jgi:DNA-binding transcriptional LysR family regulator
MQEQLGVPLLRIDGRKAVLTEAGRCCCAARATGETASQLEDLAHHMEQGWEPKVRLVVDAAYPSVRLVRALTAFMPQSRGCRVRCAKRCCRGRRGADGRGRPGHQRLEHSGYLGAELSTVEFVAVAHPEHPCTACNANSASRTWKPRCRW